MKTHLLSLCLFLLGLPLIAQFNWVEAIPTNALGQEVFLGVCTAPSGEVFAAGYAGAGAPHPILQRYAANGTPGFTRSLTGTGIAYDVDYDATNNRVVLGGTLNGNPHLELIDPATGASFSTALLNGTGVIKGIDVTATHIFVIGNYSGVLGFSSLSISGGSAFVAQFDLAGNAIRVINIQSLNAKGFDVKADAAGDVYFSFTTQSDVFFGTGFPGNYTYTSTSNEEEYVLTRANSTLQAQWSSLVRRTDFPVSVATEVPIVVDDDLSRVYIASPFEPNTTPTVSGGITAFDQATGAFQLYAPLPGRTPRDLTISCGELFATGGKEQSFGRAPCNNNGHAAWYEGYGTTLTPGGPTLANTCSYGEAINTDVFGRLVLTANYFDANDLTWGTLSSDPAAGSAVVTQVETGLSCCTQSVERCLDFDGNNDGVLFGTSPLNGRTDFTVELWFKDEGAVSTAQRTLFFNAGSLFAAGVRSGDLFIQASAAFSNNITPVSPNRWHHLAMTYTGNSLTTYLDGTAVDQRTVTLSLLNLFHLGQYGLTNPPWSWQGQMDEVSVYDYAKGPAELLAGINCSRDGSEPGLLLYLPLDQGQPGQPNLSVGTVIDQSPLGNNGSLQNFALNGQAGNWVCSDLILPTCPVDTCGAQLPVNTFSRYREYLDAGSAPTDKELDIAQGAFRLPQGNIIQLGVVAGSDVHNPIYVEKSDSKGDPVGQPGLYHPTTGNEAVQLQKDGPTPIRDAAGNLTGFLAIGITEQAGANQQRVLLRFDTNLVLQNSRFYQPIIPGVREWFSDIIQDSNGDYIAIGRIDQTLYNSGFVMKIEPNLNIARYHKLEDFGQDIYPDKIIEGRFNFGGMGGGINSVYILGGRTLSGDLWAASLDQNLQPSGSSTQFSLAVPGTGNTPQYLAGLDLLSDGRLVMTGTDKSGQIWLNLVSIIATPQLTGSFLIDVDGGTEAAYDTELLSGNRLLIGGRAEAINSSNDSARALLLEVDLNAATVNWVRTYGNSSYPESLVLDVSADDRGILLSGYGITAVGVNAGGFFGDLNHFDSWLAATDTTGRVFDCDCYESSFATVNSQVSSLGFIGLSFSPVVKGQDDLEQELVQTLPNDYFCDQYTAPPASPICPGGSDADREDLADNTLLTDNSGVWTLDNPSLPAGFELIINWDDGTTQTILASQLPVQHTYQNVGNYVVMIDYVTYASDGTICWQQNESVQVVSSAQERTPSVSIKAYPNPTDGVVYLDFPLLHGYPQAVVYSAAGQPVRTVDQLQDRRIDLSGLPGGVYVLQLRFPDGAMARRRVVLR